MSQTLPGAFDAQLPRRSATANKTALARMLMTFLFLSVIAPAWIWLLLPLPREFGSNAFLSLLVAEFAALRLTVLAFRAEPRLIATTFYVFVYVWGGLAAFAQNCTGIFPWIVRHSPEHAYAAMLHIIVAVFAYEVGQLLAARSGRREAPPLTFEVSHRAVVWICVAALPLLVIGMLILGGPDILFATRAAYNWAVALGTSSTMASLVGSSLFRAPAFVAFILVTIVLWRDWKTLGTSRRRTFVLLFLYTGGLAFVGNYPLSLPRQWLGTVVLTPLFAILPWHRWQIAVLGPGLVALLLFVFPYADAFRRTGLPSIEAVSKALETSVIDNVLSKGDFDVYQLTANGIVVTETEGFSYGRNFVGAAFFWFPRSLWPSKPYGTGMTVAYEIGYPWHQTNLSAPLWMEAYWAFGWLGIVFIIAGYSYLSGKLDQAFMAARRDGAVNSLALIAVPFFAAYQFILMRGDILNGTAQAAPVVVLFLLAVKLRRFSPGTAP